MRTYIVCAIMKGSCIKIEPALHRNTVCVNAGELILPTASECEQDLVGVVRGALARVVEHRPLGGAQQPRCQAGPVCCNHLRVSHVARNPEVGARVVHNICLTQANVTETTFLVVDWSEHILEC